jgi:uncharacterized membrane protein
VTVMADESRTEESNGLKSVLDELPVDRLKSELQGALSAVAGRATEVAADKISDLTDRLVDVAAGGGVTGKALAEGGKAAATGHSPLVGALKGGVMGVKDKAKDALSGGSGNSSGGKKATKSTNIIEEIDVGVPVDVAYNQWTQFQDFSGFMKKVENVDQQSDEKLNFKAKILWSHRTWEASILEQVPDEKIVWRSKGEKGHVDGSVTFHELAPNLTRILVVLEYYPQGLFERVGNIWRAQGRRARLELKHFRRHVMTNVILDPDQLEGWRGEIHRGRVERSHEDAVADEQDDGDESSDQDEYDEDESTDEYDEDDDEDEAGDQDEAGEDESTDEYDEDESTDEYEDEGEDEGEEQPEDEYEDEGEEAGDEEEADEEEEPADEYEDEGEDEEQPEDEYEDEEAEDEEEAGDEDEYDEEEPADEYEDEEYDEEEPEERPRRRAS